jgi:hypothetical protein
MGVGDEARPAVTRPGDVDHVHVARVDDAIEMNVEEVEPRRRPPMPEEPGLGVIEPERLAEQRIVEQIDLPDRQIVGGAPPVVHAAQEVGRESLVVHLGDSIA